MQATPVPYRFALHPLHAVLLAGTVPLFLGALLSDLAYWRSHEIQWSNFASWLLVGGLLFGGIALAWALVAVLRSAHRAGRALLYLGLLAATWLLALYDALVHARDAWAIMPAALVLSVLVVLLASVATWAGFAGYRHGDRA